MCTFTAVAAVISVPLSSQIQQDNDVADAKQLLGLIEQFTNPKSGGDRLHRSEAAKFQVASALAQALLTAKMQDLNDITKLQGIDLDEED